ncbi:hypothetical protein TELCIR_06447 [Teladorsagia circumcincta]|uniref:Tetratricopeptide repeat protein n=1 Tax=Teladorsagia circumcincta TaxID=45464 RepID=A0A2G9UN69_TELCI|nr:hypothetical protein TELCIR_06447 [Teladorsagia circumcincta]
MSTRTNEAVPMNYKLQTGWAEVNRSCAVPGRVKHIGMMDASRAHTKCQNKATALDIMPLFLPAINEYAKLLFFFAHNYVKCVGANQVAVLRGISEDEVPDRAREQEALVALSAAQSSRQSGNIKRAKMIIEHALALAPNHPDILTEYGLFHEVGSFLI